MTDEMMNLRDFVEMEERGLIQWIKSPTTP